MCLVRLKVAPFYPSSSQNFDIGRGQPSRTHPMWHISERFLTIRDGSTWIFALATPLIGTKFDQKRIMFPFNVASER